MDEKEKQYREKYEEYRILNRQRSEIEARMKKIKGDVAALLHEDKVNEKLVELSNGEIWKSTYQTTSRTSTDLKSLMEIVGPKVYGEVVTQKESTFLVIKKAGKDVIDSSLLNTKPIEEDATKPFVPGGTVLS